MRRACVLSLVASVVWLLGGGTALSKEFTLPSAEVHAKVRPDGSIRVTEHITYSFSGSFSGGFREIPLRPGEDVVDVQVSEDGVPYAPGAPASIGSSGSPGTFGTASIGTGVRIVWHYAASDEERTFTVEYTLVGVAEAWNDIVDVYLQIWGEEWDVELEHLTGRVIVPNQRDGTVRVWGHATGVEGGTLLLSAGRGASFVAEHVPPDRFVEVRVVFPRDQLTSTAGAKVRSGDRLDFILDEEAELAAVDAADRGRARWFRDNLPWLVTVALLLAFAPAAALAVWVYRRHGREPRVDPGPRYVFEPPGNEPPALIAALVAEKQGRATGDAFTATLFDLIRRGYLSAMPATTVKETWGGLRSEDISDLIVGATGKSTGGLERFEATVADAVAHAAGGATFELSRFGEKIAAEPAHYAAVFSTFRQEVAAAVTSRGWWDVSGGRPVGVAVFFAALAALVLGITAGTYDASAGPGAVFTQIAWWVATGIAVTNMLILIAFQWLRRGWERRTPEGARAAVQWSAFRRFLGDFAGMKEAVPGSIEIWESYLCYGIAFGVADRVLAAAQLRAPEELRDASGIYWISYGGSPGSGPSLFAISDISHSVASAATPSSGGGGGFSGGAAAVEAVAEEAPGSGYSLPGNRPRRFDSR